MALDDVMTEAILITLGDQSPANSGSVFMWDIVGVDMDGLFVLVDATRPAGREPRLDTTT